MPLFFTFVKDLCSPADVFARTIAADHAPVGDFSQSL